ncbi:MAG: hypothetical protein Q8T08_03390, partial [Ignavibacteria bacterium]|nr:hypothetical protein [Ignavibacteria bacterium]
MFPRILSLSVTLDVSQKELTLEELRQAVELTRNNASIVDFALSNLQPWNPWTEEGHSRTLLMALAIRNSLMRKLTTDLIYIFFQESNFEEEAISEGLKNSTSIKKVNFLLNGERGQNLIRSLRINKELESIATALYGRKLSTDEVEDLIYLIVNSLSLKSLQLQVSFDDFLILS